jgi:hypothetical protein
MDIKRHMLNFFFISILVDRGKEWDNYKMKVVIRKSERKWFKILIGKKWNS